MGVALPVELWRVTEGKCDGPETSSDSLQDMDHMTKFTVAAYAGCR